MREAKDDLQRMITKHVVGRNVTLPEVRRLMEMVDHHRSNWRARGVDFPRLTLFVVPRLGYLKLVAADLDMKAVQTHVLNATVEQPEVTPQELAEAVNSAWPHLRGRSLVDHESRPKSVRLSQDNIVKDQDGTE